MKKHIPQRSPENAQISFSLPRSLLSQIDSCAKLDGRSRSNWLVKILSDACEEHGLPVEKNGETKAEATSPVKKTA